MISISSTQITRYDSPSRVEYLNQRANSPNRTPLKKSSPQADYIQYEVEIATPEKSSPGRQGKGSPYKNVTVRPISPGKRTAFGSSTQRFASPTKGSPSRARPEQESKTLVLKQRIAHEYPLNNTGSPNRTGTLSPDRRGLNTSTRLNDSRLGPVSTVNNSLVITPRGTQLSPTRSNVRAYQVGGNIPLDESLRATTYIPARGPTRTISTLVKGLEEEDDYERREILENVDWAGYKLMPHNDIEDEPIGIDFTDYYRPSPQSCFVPKNENIEESYALVYKGKGIPPKLHPLYPNMGMILRCRKCWSHRLLITYAMLEQVPGIEVSRFWEYNGHCVDCNAHFRGEIGKPEFIWLTINNDKPAAILLKNYERQWYPYRTHLYECLPKVSL